MQQKNEDHRSKQDSHHVNCILGLKESLDSAMAYQNPEHDQEVHDNAEGKVASLFLVEVVQMVQQAERGAHELSVAVQGPLWKVVLLSPSVWVVDQQDLPQREENEPVPHILVIGMIPKRGQHHGVDNERVNAIDGLYELDPGVVGQLVEVLDPEVDVGSVD